MKILLLVIVLLISTCSIYSQNEWGGTPYGYVKADVMLDSRQTESVRDGQVLLYPKKPAESKGGDANDGMVFNILAVQSRFGYKIKAPDFLGAKSTGVMEGEYFGSADADIGSVRLRLAYVKLDWGNHEVQAGHNWHPMFTAEAYAQTISFNTGIPFVPFARSPLVTYSYKVDKFKFMLTGATEMEFPSTGPIGKSTTYIRNAGLPMVNLGLRYDNGNVLLAANANYKELKPRLLSEKGYKEDNVSKGIIANFLARYKTDDFFITATALVGQNTYDLLMLGGYAVSNIDTVTGIWEYTPIDVGSLWLDTQYGKDLTVGFFGGFSKNFGAEDTIRGSYFSRNKDIDYLYRLSPRISYKSGNTQISAELEYTVAAYGENDSKGRVVKSEEVGNLRVLLAAFIYF